MKRVLFVSNGHGEEAIAGCLARELQTAWGIRSDHLGLVGDYDPPSAMQLVGPRRAMPSGGLLAMGNVRNIASDIRAGLVAHTLAQWRFLRGVRGTYGAIVAVGDIFALLMAKAGGGARTLFVGTAKSVYVAPYGAVEERIMRGADAIYVRDQETAARLLSHGIAAQAPGNVIVDLFGEYEPAVPPFDQRLAIFPGSRESAYGDAVFLCALVRSLLPKRPALGATLSIAPGLDPRRFARDLQAAGWSIAQGRAAHSPFCLVLDGLARIDAWSGPPGALLQSAVLVLGQAGTANEAAAAHGIPVLAFEHPGSRRHGWYRMRQRGLLGDAMKVVTGDVAHAAAAVEALLADEPARTAMGRTGRLRMGPAGGTAVIAAKIGEMVNT